MCNVKGMNRFELLALSSCVPIRANKQYEYNYHFVCPFHVVAPYLFKSYFPGIIILFTYKDTDSKRSNNLLSFVHLQFELSLMESTA